MQSNFGIEPGGLVLGKMAERGNVRRAGSPANGAKLFEDHDFPLSPEIPEFDSRHDEVVIHGIESQRGPGAA